MMSCKESAHLFENDNIDQLSLFKKVVLRVHLLICKSCRYYHKNMLNLLHHCKKFYRIKSPQQEKIISEKFITALKEK